MREPKFRFRALPATSLFFISIRRTTPPAAPRKRSASMACETISKRPARQSLASRRIRWQAMRNSRPNTSSAATRQHFINLTGTLQFTYNLRNVILFKGWLSEPPGGAHYAWHCKCLRYVLRISRYAGSQGIGGDRYRSELANHACALGERQLRLAGFHGPLGLSDAARDLQALYVAAHPLFAQISYVADAVFHLFRRRLCDPRHLFDGIAWPSRLARVHSTSARQCRAPVPHGAGRRRPDHDL